jgi:hypothetical protein
MVAFRQTRVAMKAQQKGSREKSSQKIVFLNFQDFSTFINYVAMQKNPKNEHFRRKNVFVNSI